MKFRLPFFCISLLFLYTGIGKASAADTTTARYPSVVLFQLRSEHNRISAMLQNNDIQEAELVAHEAEEVTKRVHLDFNENFGYCPVYYYMDTNADRIKKREFNGVLMNDKGEFVYDVVPPGDSTTYVIVYYGYALSQAKYKKELEDTFELANNPQMRYQMDNKPIVKKSSRYTYDPDPPRGKSLVILNPKFHQLTYFYKIAFDEYKFSLGKSAGPTHYRSKKYDIEYYPLARVFNQTMLDRYGRRRIVIKNNSGDSK